MNETTTGGRPSGAVDLVLESLSAGWSRMVWLLFTGPYANVTNWLWWGLILLLAGVASFGSGGNGTSGDFDSHDFGGGSGRDGLSAGVILLIVGGICCALLIAIAFLYIRSRFRFIMLDGVLSGEPRIKDVWPRTSEIGLQYFVWELVLGLTVLLLLIPVFLMWLPLIRAGISGGDVEAFQIIPLVLGSLAYVIPLILVKLVIDWFVYDLVLPCCWGRPIGFLDGLRAAAALAGQNVGATVLFLLGRIVVGVAGAIAGLIIVCVSCCIWGIPVAVIVAIVIASVAFPPAFILTGPLVLAIGIGIAWLMTTLMAPIYLFYRSWSLAYVSLLDPDAPAFDEGTSFTPPEPSPPAAPPLPERTAPETTWSPPERPGPTSGDAEDPGGGWEPADPQ